MEWSHKIYKDMISTHAIRVLKKAHITTVQVTVFNLLFTIIFGCYFFSRGTYLGNILGLGVCAVNVLLDYIDGDLARQTNTSCEVGAWLDTGGDIIIRNGIMAALAYGICRVGPPSLLAVIMLYIVSCNAMNVISLYYNNTFGFDSYTGNKLFRKYMEEKPTLLNRAMKNIIDPTSSTIGLVLFTVRYWLVIGIIFHVMKYVFICLAVIVTFQAIVMFTIYGLHLAYCKKLWVLQALAIIDEDRKEYYGIRGCQKI